MPEESAIERVPMAEGLVEEFGIELVDRIARTIMADNPELYAQNPGELAKRVEAHLFLMKRQREWRKKTTEAHKKYVEDLRKE